MNRLRALLRCHRGTAAVEFAIIGAVLIALIVATIDFGRTYYVKNHLSHLADTATRKMLIDPDVTDAEIENMLRSGFYAGNSENLTVTIGSASAGGTNYRELTIGFPISLFIPGLSSETIALSVTRRVPTR